MIETSSCAANHRHAVRLGKSLLSLILAASTALVASRAAATDLFPLESVRPGMEGIGRTVFEGSRIDEFHVRILGVLRNVGPKQSVILAQLEGGPLDRAGVMAGMSGSPILVEGKLVGAVAYSFPFAKETIAGITPIEEMIEPARSVPSRETSAGLPLPFGPGGPLRTLDFRELGASMGRRSSATMRLLGLAGDDSAGMRTCQALSLPLVFSGFDAGAIEWAHEVFSGLGFIPIAGGGAATSAPMPDLAPGGALGVSLVEGDLDLSMTGTVTHIDGDRVYAFGHPFYNLGPTQFPMKKAYVYSIFPSLHQSWKISTTGELVGTIEQDRAAAMIGKLGKIPELVPVEVRIRTSRGGARQYSFRIVEDELLSPLLTYVSLLSVLQANERSYGVCTVRIVGRLALDSGQELVIDDLIATNQSAQEVASIVATPLAYLLSNEFERTRAKRLAIEVEAAETLRTARIERVWLDRGGQVRAGDRRTLRIRLRNYRGESVVESIPLDLPRSLRPGLHALHVMDADAITRFEQIELRRIFVPRTLAQLIRAINDIHRSNRLHLRLVHRSAGAVVAGEPMPALPPSVMEVLHGQQSGTDIVPLRSAAAWAFDLPTPFAVQGSMTLWLTIEE